LSTAVRCYAIVAATGTSVFS